MECRGNGGEEIKRKLQRIKNRNVEKSFRNEKHRQISTESCEGKTMGSLGTCWVWTAIETSEKCDTQRSQSQKFGEMPVWRSESTPTRDMSCRLELKSPNNNLNTAWEGEAAAQGSHPRLTILKLWISPRWEESLAYYWWCQGVWHPAESSRAQPRIQWAWQRCIVVLHEYAKTSREWYKVFKVSF